MMRRILSSTLLLLSAATLMWGQSQIPGPIGGDASVPTFAGEAAQKNYLTANIRASAQVDDNALNDNRNKLTDVVSTFQPDIMWNLSRAHWQWMVDYSPGLAYSEEIPNYRSFSNALNSAFQMQVSSRLSFRVRDSFTRTSNPFVRLEQPTAVSTFGILDRPNHSLYGQPIQYSSEQVGADVDYLLGPHTTVGVSGTYAMVSYDNIYSASNTVQDINSTGARAYVSQKLSPVQSVGAAYSYQLVDSDPFGKTLVHGIMLFDTLQFKSNVSVSVFGGPQYVDQHLGSASPAYELRPGWSWMAGGSISWSVARTGFSASVARRVSDSGGLSGGALRLTDITAGVTRKLTKRWNGSANVGYSINSSDIGYLSNDVGYLSAGVGVSREIVRNFALDVRYWYSHQTNNQALAGTALLADHNRVSIGLSYSFSHALGR